MVNDEYKILKEYGKIGTRKDRSGKTWEKVVALVSWRGRLPLYDLREWSTDRKEAKAGTRLNQYEIARLTELLVVMMGEQKNDNNGRDDRGTETETATGLQKEMVCREQGIFANVSESVEVQI